MEYRRIIYEIDPIYGNSQIPDDTSTILVDFDKGVPIQVLCTADSPDQEGPALNGLINNPNQIQSILEQLANPEQPKSAFKQLGDAIKQQFK